jgi:hypothetical protein
MSLLLLLLLLLLRPHLLVVHHVLLLLVVHHHDVLRRTTSSSTSHARWRLNRCTLPTATPAAATCDECVKRCFRHWHHGHELLQGLWRQVNEAGEAVGWAGEHARPKHLPFGDPEKTFCEEHEPLPPLTLAPNLTAHQRWHHLRMRMCVCVGVWGYGNEQKTNC